MIESLIHTPDGQLKSLDPYEHYCVPGNKIRCINAFEAQNVSAHLIEGAIGYIDDSDAFSNRSQVRNNNRGYRKIYARWPKEGLTNKVRESYHYDGNEQAHYYVPETAIEPYIGG